MKNGERGNEYHQFTIEPVPRIQIKGEINSYPDLTLLRCEIRGKRKENRQLNFQ